MSGGAAVEGLLRELAPQVLTRLVRRYGDFDSSEDAVQEALLAAAQQWPDEGVPENPRGWLVTVASRRLIEMVRSDAARRRREAGTAQREPPPGEQQPSADDSLTLLLLCCHPSLTPASQVALTLRAVGGLTTAEIARAYLVPEATIGQRISRAKQRITASGARFRLPSAEDRPRRIAGVLQVLYLVFNEGYTASSGAELVRTDLVAEAVRLARQLHAAVPEDGEAAGLLALMLLTDARRAARTRDDGALVPLAEQDRGRWDRNAIDEGLALVERTLASGPVGPYQLQAAIAAVHAEAPRAEDTDWPQILALYDLLRLTAPGPMVTLNRVVAVAMVHGAEEGLRLLREVEAEEALAGHHRVDAVRAHLLELVGDRTAAREAYLRAARRTLSVPEQRYLRSRAVALGE
ncbi:RNA polymerase sigma factor [Prauserella muralis]|uniref:RNA polymerase subunit sigma-24 n=1 Tax=Prauserella muralis TaxID=588067 RepID=A0A2V4B0E0_9PSEU|nr:sigma-70 family RNA polymerase sigma factor [Prauserella muralis]PXY27473.1 RNA polymerase subunit sigma-24 [Prauserella muralis]TWE22815.1 RNA polymerase sigma factor (sigma-70 family) [Prauserella muralis]